MRALALGTLLVMAGTACTALPPETSEVSQAILNGTADSGDPAAVLLRWPGWLCSGTLMTPRLVLTAGHCADGDAGTPPSSVYFGPGPTISAGTSVQAERTIRHPQFSNDLASGGTVKNDVAIVVLKQPLTTVTPVPPNFTPLTSSMIVGRNIKYVGFGKQGGADNAPLGTKQTVTVIGRLLTGENIDAGTATCSGDSGGPAFMSIGGHDVIIGVTSWGPTNCLDASVSQRVDIHKDWILGIEAQYDPAKCTADGRCAAGCATPDPDCVCQADGICTAGCADPDPDCGDPCRAEGHCVEDCPQRDPDCPAPLPLGDSCHSEFECGTGNACLQLEAGTPSVCTAKCGAGLAACGAGDSCEALAEAKPPLSVCKPAAAGCTAAPGGRASPLSLTLVVGLLLLGRYSRRRRNTSPRQIIES